MILAGVYQMIEDKEYLSINELKPGMITAEEIKTENTVLIKAGNILTEGLIKELREKYFFSKVAVFSTKGESENYYDKYKQSTVEEVQQSFNRISSNIHGLFEEISEYGISDIQEIRDFAKNIQKELASPRAIVKNIVLNGSGSDVIYRHSVNVAALSTILAKWIGLSEKESNLLTYSAILHDFGKIKINQGILNKPHKLSEYEFREIKRHPVIGYDLLKEIPFLDASVRYGILMHHERRDGSGYPFGIKEDKIHIFAKIIAIVDVFDAINSNRMHRKSKRPFEALEIIQEESLHKLHYEYCRIFLDHVVNYYIGEKVLLNNNKVCDIIQININDINHPLLFDGSEFIDLKNKKDLCIEKLIL